MSLKENSLPFTNIRKPLLIVFFRNRSPECRHKLHAHRVTKYLARVMYGKQGPNFQNSGNSFALFLKSQRKWESPAITPEHGKQFKALVKENNFDAQRYGVWVHILSCCDVRFAFVTDCGSTNAKGVRSHIVPHGSYLVNLAQDDAAKASQAYECFLDDLRRSESLGIKLYNFQ
jgi:endonuclease IV